MRALTLRSTRSISASGRSQGARQLPGVTQLGHSIHAPKMGKPS
jgi:hypothetical protein